MNVLRLLVRQIRYEDRAFWRNPASAFFTFAFPLIFMFVFQAIFGNQVEASGLTAAAFFTPAIVAFSVVNACFTTLAMTVVAVREEGILKRVRGLGKNRLGDNAETCIFELVGQEAEREAADKKKIEEKKKEKKP